MNTNNLREDIVVEIAKRMSGIGRTAMMKVIYLLQQAYGVPLKYDFTLYNYGPYADGVLTSIGIAKRDKRIKMDDVDYGDDIMGCRISADPEASTGEAVKFADEIDAISQIFGKYTAKKWELAATIVYVHVAYVENERDFKELPDNIKRIKPRFTLPEINAEYRRLRESGILDKAVSHQLADDTAK